MKNNILGLRTTIYQVNDLEEATRWYSKAFNTEPYFNEPFYVGFDIAGYELGLQPDKTVAAHKNNSVVAYWGVDDIEATYNRFLALGALTEEAPNEVGGGIFVATVLDPWGNFIGLILNPHFDLNKTT